MIWSSPESSAFSVLELVTSGLPSGIDLFTAHPPAGPPGWAARALERQPGSPACERVDHQSFGRVVGGRILLPGQGDCAVAGIVVEFVPRMRPCSADRSGSFNWV